MEHGNDNQIIIVTRIINTLGNRDGVPNVRSAITVLLPTVGSGGKSNCVF
jgi:hypothetical protein